MQRIFSLNENKCSMKCKCVKTFTVETHQTFFGKQIQNVLNLMGRTNKFVVGCDNGWSLWMNIFVFGAAWFRKLTL